MNKHLPYNANAFKDSRHLFRFDAIRYVTKKTADPNSAEVVYVETTHKEYSGFSYSLWAATKREAILAYVKLMGATARFEVTDLTVPEEQAA